MPPPHQRSPLTLFLLKYPLFILIALGVAGAVAWRSMRPPAPPVPVAQKPLPTPSEAARPDIKAALRPILDTFFTNATIQTHIKARAAILAYRKSFADAVAPDYIDPPDALRCVPAECDMKRQKLTETLHPVERALEKQFAPLGKDSPAYHASLIEALALDRRFPLRDITPRLVEYDTAFKYEQAVQHILTDYFRLLDEAAVAGDLRSSGSFRLRDALMQYYAKFAQAQSNALRRFRFYDTCPSLDGQPLDDPFREAIKLCHAAVAEYETLERQIDAELRPYRYPNPPHPDPETRDAAIYKRRVAVIKKMLSERTAPQVYVRTKANSFWQ